MKIKKIKNLILTFVICLFGALTFNTIKASALQIAPGFSANDGTMYIRNDQPQTYIILNAQTKYNYDERLGDIYLRFTLSSYTNLNYGSYSAIWGCVTSISSDSSGSSYSFTCNLSSSNPTTALGDNYYNPSTISNIAYGYFMHDSLGYYIIMGENINSPISEAKTYTKSSASDIAYQTGYDTGFLEGENEGYSTGYDVGFIDGLGDRNTLVGMVGAIFTGPVTMLQSILNFNILGVNFADMLLGLTTLLVVIWLIKRFI